MASVSSIAAAIATQLDALTWVDSASSTNYLPAAANVTCVAFVIPFDQESSVVQESLSANVTMVHQLTVEFWIQVKTSAIATAMATAQDACTLAIVKLVNMDGTGYVLDAGLDFQERIEPAPVTHVGVPWIVAALRVPVRNEVTV